MLLSTVAIHTMQHTLRSWIMDTDLPTQVDMGGTLQAWEACVYEKAALFTIPCCIFAYENLYT